MHATLRNLFYRSSGPERAGPGDDRALPRYGDLEERHDPPPRRLGPPAARVSARQGAQGALRAHEHRVRRRDAERTGALLQVQRRGAAPSDREDGTRLDDAVAHDEGGEGDVGPRPGRSAAWGRTAQRSTTRGAGQ